MPRGPRRGATSARRVQRKVEKTLLATHGGYEGPSLIELLETELLEATIRYLQLKDEPEEKVDELVYHAQKLKLGQARGVMRGCATAVAIVRNPYTADEPQVIKLIEREFVKLARASVKAE